MVLNNKRRAARVLVDLPVVVESIGQSPLSLAPALEGIYERVLANDQRKGDRVLGTICDLSSGGAFIAAEPLPLLSRVGLQFTLGGHGEVEAIGWVLWRRTADCEIEREGVTARLPQGFGVLFEGIPIDARLAIHKMALKLAPT